MKNDTQKMDYYYKKANREINQWRRCEISYVPTARQFRSNGENCTL